jgi:hypothetical protein
VTDLRSVDVHHLLLCSLRNRSSLACLPSPSCRTVVDVLVLSTSTRSRTRLATCDRSHPTNCSARFYMTVFGYVSHVRRRPANISGMVYAAAGAESFCAHYDTIRTALRCGQHGAHVEVGDVVSKRTSWSSFRSVGRALTCDSIVGFSLLCTPSCRHR